MSDYGGFEKVGTLPLSFTTSNSQISTAPGDIMLYQGNQMVIFYGTNSWSYTRLGKIDNATAESVSQFLGNRWRKRPPKKSIYVITTDINVRSPG